MKPIKLCRVTKQGIFSISAKGKAKLKYIVGEWTEAKPEFLEHGLGICVFESIGVAMTWVDERNIRMPDFYPALFRIEYGKLWEPKTKMFSTFELADGNFREISSPFPEGTLMADRIKLIKHCKLY